jgi:hypothetical protein
MSLKLSTLTLPEITASRWPAMIETNAYTAVWFNPIGHTRMLVWISASSNTADMEYSKQIFQ